MNSTEVSDVSSSSPLVEGSMDAIVLCITAIIVREANLENVDLRQICNGLIASAIVLSLYRRSDRASNIV